MRYNQDEFYIDHYKNNGQAFIICQSGKSGNRYIIDEDGCDCDGFKYRKRCRHYDAAETLGLINEMNEENEKLKTFDLPDSKDNLFIVCYKEHENRLIVNADQLITVLDNARKHHSSIKVFKLGEKVIDWA